MSDDTTNVDVLASGTDQLILPSASTLISSTATQLVIFVPESASATSTPSPSTKSLLVIIISAVVGGIVLSIVFFLILLWLLRRKRAAGLPLQFQYERQSSFLARQGGGGVEGGRTSDSGSQDSLGWKEGGESHEPKATSYFIDPSQTFQPSPPPPLNTSTNFPPPRLTPSSPAPFSSYRTSIQPTFDSPTPISSPQLYIQSPQSHHYPSLSSLSIPNTTIYSSPGSQTSLYNPSASSAHLAVSSTTQLPVPPSPCQLAREDPFAEYQGAPQVVATAEDAKASSTGRGRKRAGSKSSTGHGGSAASAWGGSISNSNSARVSRTSSSASGRGSSEGHGQAKGRSSASEEGSFVMMELGARKGREEMEVGYAF